MGLCRGCGGVYGVVPFVYVLVLIPFDFYFHFFRVVRLVALLGVVRLYVEVNVLMLEGKGMRALGTSCAWLSPRVCLIVDVWGFFFVVFFVLGLSGRCLGAVWCSW